MGGQAFDGFLKRVATDTGLVRFLKRVGLKDPVLLLWLHLRDPRRIGHQLALLDDYLSFRRRYQFLSEDTGFTDSKKPLLVVSLSNWVSQVKQEAMLAKALQLRGYTPVILTLRTNRTAIKYFRVFGFEQLVFFDDFMPRRLPLAAAQELTTLLDGQLTLQDLKAYQFHGVSIGRQALGTASRALHLGRIKLSDPPLQRLLREFLPEAMKAVLAAEAVLDRVRPQTALFNERGYISYGPVYELALQREINSVQFVYSHRDDALIFKRYKRETQRQHPFSLSLETWEYVRTLPWTTTCETELMEEFQERYVHAKWVLAKRLQEGKTLKEVEEIRRQLQLDPQKKTVVVFCPLPWDATYFYGEDLFDDFEDWLVATVRAACANPHVNWVIKLHPANLWKLKRERKTGELTEWSVLRNAAWPLPAHVKVLSPDTDINTFSLVPLTDYCITVRGTIGIEMACFGVTVLTAGTGRYSGFGFSIDSISIDEYLAKLRSIQELPRLSEEQRILAKKHAYALLKLRPLPLQTFQQVFMPSDTLGHPLDHNVVINARTLNDLLRAQDLRAFAEWAEGSSLDYLQGGWPQMAMEPSVVLA